MECPICHAQNRSEAKYCQTCGAALTSHRSKVELHTKHEQSHPNDLPITAPLSTRIDGFNPLPVGALLDRGRYVVWEILTTGKNVNIYKVEDIVPARQCTSCGSVERNANTHICVVCKANLENALPINLRYIAEEKINTKNNNVEQMLMDLDIQHPGLYLPHSIFTETPYGQERYYRLSAENSPLSLRTLSEKQELPTVLAWGVVLAESLDILHKQLISPGSISLDDIVVVNDVLSWANLHRAIQMEQASQETAAKFYQDNVCDLANILWYLATQQTKITQQTDIPEDVYALFSKAEKGVLNARELADGLKKQLTTLQRPVILKMLSGKCTDVGQTRSLNEDSLLTIEYAAIYRSASIPLGMYAVADGMGGHDAGDVASRLTCQALGKQFVNDLMSPTVSDILPENVSDWLTKAFIEANQAVYKERQTTHSDMGNTLVAALFVGNSATIANVGDSRCYHLTQPNIKQITRDHSLVERLVEAGQITRNQAIVHPQKNVIYRVIGDKMEVDVDVFELRLEFGEALLLCSDGLSGMLSDSRIHKIWQASQSPQQACDRLVEAANQAGGEDNITVIIVQVLP